MATRLSENGAVESLFRENETDLRNYVGGKLGKSGAVDVDDIVQEAFLRISTQETAAEIDNPRGFLFRVARNLTFDLLRRRTVRQAYVASHSVELSSDRRRYQSRSAESVVSAGQDLALILDAIEELPPQCQKVFLLQRREGLAYAEIGRRLGISESMVQKHMSKALSRLYDVLPEDPG